METMPDIMEAKVNNTRVWLFRVLVAAAAGVMLVAWFMPWWTMDIEGFGYDAAQIRPWGLVTSERLGSFDIMLKGTELPGWFAPFMWAYLALCMIALLVGIFVPGKDFCLGKIRFSLSQLLVGGVGFSYIFAGIVAAVYAGMRMKNTFDVSLQGRTRIDFGDPFTTYVNTSLLLGYYLIYVAGLLLIVLALLRDKITGELKPNA
jgi:hypothetical protein